MRQFSRAFGILAVIGLILLGSVVLTPSTAEALPWRPTDTPLPQPAPPPAGLELQTTGAPATAWTVVQWQDGLGGWHDVVGWQCPLDEAGRALWWVESPDWGTKPFRWVIYVQRGGDVWAISEPFSLPSESGEKKVVVVTAAPVSPAAAPLTYGTYAFSLIRTGVLYTSRPKSCGQYSIAGQVVDHSGAPIHDQVFSVKLITPSGKQRWVLTGEPPATYPWRFEFTLGAELETGTYQVQLYTVDRQPISSSTSVEMKATCDRNIGWVVWMVTSP